MDWSPLFNILNELQPCSPDVFHKWTGSLFWDQDGHCDTPLANKNWWDTYLAGAGWSSWYESDPVYYRDSLLLGQARSIRRLVIKRLNEKGVPNRLHDSLAPDLFQTGLVAALGSFYDKKTGRPILVDVDCEPGDVEFIDGELVDHGDENQAARKRILNAAGNAIDRALYGRRKRLGEVEWADDFFESDNSEEVMNEESDDGDVKRGTNATSGDKLFHAFRFSRQKEDLSGIVEFDSLLVPGGAEIDDCRYEYARNVIRDALLAGECLEVARLRAKDYSYARIEEETGINKDQARRKIDRALDTICAALNLQKRSCRRGRRSQKLIVSGAS